MPLLWITLFLSQELSQFVSSPLWYQARSSQPVWRVHQSLSPASSSALPSTWSPTTLSHLSSSCAGGAAPLSCGRVRGESAPAVWAESCWPGGETVSRVWRWGTVQRGDELLRSLVQEQEAGAAVRVSDIQWAQQHHHQLSEDTVQVHHQLAFLSEFLQLKYCLSHTIIINIISTQDHVHQLRHIHWPQEHGDRRHQ